MRRAQIDFVPLIGGNNNNNNRREYLTLHKIKKMFKKNFPSRVNKTAATTSTNLDLYQKTYF